MAMGDTLEIDIAAKDGRRASRIQPPAAAAVGRANSPGHPRAIARRNFPVRRSTLPPAVNARQVQSHSTEWVVQKGALREARAAVIPRGDRRNRAVCQARLLLEVARRVAEPVEGFPPGSRATVRLGLYRQAAYWTLVASRHDDAEPPSDSPTPGPTPTPSACDGPLATTSAWRR